MIRPYLLSGGAGILIGLIYSVLHIRSPAPPVIALVGLLGILCGEQIIPFGKHILAGTTPSTAWQQSGCAQHLFGRLPGGQVASATTVVSSNPEAGS
jgi:XapX domain-containing protein